MEQQQETKGFSRANRPPFVSAEAVPNANDTANASPHDATPSPDGEGLPDRTSRAKRAVKSQRPEYEYAGSGQRAAPGDGANPRGDGAGPSRKRRQQQADEPQRFEVEAEPVRTQGPTF